ncbi:extracellular catalytic domain type 1 short-chain-length polyhydroxyalkanoate depolymerase [Chthonobacter albigriseus]|uniref:extracellular catalytic domain type 1 short-chain-length polyhydroxyalkanoate depolymerase n=1 Tax=Chthonobacter albigriseus TaxID=1683161 RepID=UPI0015EFA5F6|nr:PHB depolymerase family esterase [Chthonobacter albigriseus]
MKLDLSALRRAASLTRAGSLVEATRQIQSALGGSFGRETAKADPGPSSRSAGAVEAPRILDLSATPVGKPATAGPASPAGGPSTRQDGPAGGTARLRKPLPEVVRGLAAARRFFDTLPGAGGASASPPIAEGARFLSREFTSPSGARPYRIYIPASAGDRPDGLVVMLHGCKQNPDDFAVGTRMNEKAEEHRLIVVYPGQLSAANPSSCWNWFSPADQRRGGGEPAILAGMAMAVAAEFGIGPERTFVAGLSAGGAMAAILAETHPDVFAAAGIHSGLPAGAATDVVSAFQAMKGTGSPKRPDRRTAARSAARLIVFHGSADRTVHPSNGEAIVASRASDAEASRDSGRTPAGRAFTRIVHRAANGVAEVEHWVIDGLGHAWSGGHEGGSYTDPAGLDASAEMLRFFLERKATA